MITGAAIHVPVTDTIKVVDGSGAIPTPDRAGLRIAQTPQAFRFDVILEAHRRAAREGRDDFTDDAAIAEWAGLTVTTFEGDVANMKLTTPEDFAREEARLGAMLGDIRTGTGYDVHALTDGDHLMLCGVRVPFNRGFLAHSDGDVGLHAIVDAILGALADGDIGSHFPPSDPKWKGAASDQFLKHAVSLVHQRGGRIANLEVTMICEAPKIGPLRDAMRAKIAEITGLPNQNCREGHHQRASWIHRTSGRYRGDRRRDRSPAMGRGTSDMTSSATGPLAFAAGSVPDAQADHRHCGSCTGGLVAAALTEIPAHPMWSIAASSPTPTMPSTRCSVSRLQHSTPSAR